jgi:hypothetical protein
MSMSTMTISSAELSRSLEIFEVKPGVRFSVEVLKDLLPDIETLLFFGKVYELDAQRLATLLRKVLNTDLAEALFGEGGTHSNELQDYLVGYEDEDGNYVEGIVEDYLCGDVTFGADIPHGEILPEVWDSLEVEVAQSIKDVADRLESVVNLLPGKQGSMMMNSMMTLNKKRPVIGDYRAQVHHAPQKENLLILDVSGSMTPGTIHRIIEDVVALSYKANADMAVVSNSCTYWVAGSYSVDDVLAACEFGGTQYEKLAPLFDRDWGTVITVADYDSSYGAKDYLAQCTGRIDEVLDISLVNRPTFMAECVGQLAGSVRPILIASSRYVLS